MGRVVAKVAITAIARASFPVPLGDLLGLVRVADLGEVRLLPPGERGLPALGDLLGVLPGERRRGELWRGDALRGEACWLRGPRLLCADAPLGFNSLCKSGQSLPLLQLFFLQ